MYEPFFGLVEKPFSLTPDPRYFYRSPSHANALELMQHGIARSDGLMVVTGISGTGKTTLCRTLLEDLDRETLTSLVLNPYISEEDLLRLILQDFGAISREENRRARQAGRAEDLLHTLREYLISLQTLGTSALVIVDEAQKLPLPVLQQIARLASLEYGRRPLLQIVLVGQLTLTEVLKEPALRALADRIQIRYRLRPLTGSETADYIRHRLTIGGVVDRATFTPRALLRVYRATQGNPRLINLVCDRALLGAFSAGMALVAPDEVDHAARILGLQPMGSTAATVLSWMRRVAAL
jgi:general secretion pathway protein A